MPVPCTGNCCHICFPFCCSAVLSIVEGPSLCNVAHLCSSVHGISRYHACMHASKVLSVSGFYPVLLLVKCCLVATEFCTLSAPAFVHWCCAILLLSNEHFIDGECREASATRLVHQRLVQDWPTPFRHTTQSDSAHCMSVCLCAGRWCPL